MITRGLGLDSENRFITRGLGNDISSVFPGIPGITILTASDAIRGFNNWTSTIGFTAVGQAPNTIVNESMNVFTAEDAKIIARILSTNSIILNSEECIKTGNTAVNTIILTAPTKTDAIVSTNKLSGDSDKKTSMNIGAAI